MAEQSSIRVKCPECGQRYRWKPHHAGRRVRCASCAAKLRYPEQPTDPMRVLEPSPETEAPSQPSAGPAEPSSNEPTEAAPGPAEAESETYELSGDPDAGLPAGGSRPADSSDTARTAAIGGSTDTGRCPKCNARVKPKAVVCVNCGFDLTKGKTLQTEVGSDEEGQWEQQVGKPRDRDAGRDAGAPADEAASLTEQQQNPDEPAAVTDYQARSKRDRARKALEEELKLKQHRRQEYVYPGILLGVGVVLQYLQLLALGTGPVAGVVGAAIGIGVQVVIMVPLLVLTLYGATAFGMAFGNLGSALLKLMAVALVPIGVTGFLMAMCATVTAIPLIGFLVPLGIMAIITWMIIVPLFDLDYVEGFQLAMAIVAVQVVAWLFVSAALPALL